MSGPGIKFTPDTLKLIEKHRRNMSVGDLSKLIGVSVCTLYSRMQELGIPRRTYTRKLNQDVQSSPYASV